MMKRNASGSIINIGSVSGVTAVVGQSVYAATKAAIFQMTRSLAREWAKEGIRVNCIAPGSTKTPGSVSYYSDPAVERAVEETIPLGRRGRTEDIANAVLFLASDYASYITGQTLCVDGGVSLIHGLPSLEEMFGWGGTK
jgi:NAD(P)-dependent dehydrogenase (short-subunit alcohol dehydrogenase family)